MIDATVVGSGPNGLAAAVTLARAGLDVCLLERAPTIGGGLRTAELTLPGFWHDVCSAVHPLALASPFFRSFQLADRVPFLIPDISYAHPLEDGRTGIAYRNLEHTVETLGRDGPAWRRLFGPLVERIDGLTAITTDQLLQWPHDPLAAFALGARVMAQGTRRMAVSFHDKVAAALFAGVAAHNGDRIPSFLAAGAGLLLGAHAHAAGWGLPVGGSQAIADALADDFRAHGGLIECGYDVRSPKDLAPSRVTILDTSPEFLLTFGGDLFPPSYRRQLRRFRRGHGIAKVDFALSEAIPWRDPLLRETPTIHIGGTAHTIADAENAVAAGRIPENPYVLAVQPTVVDPSRAPEGRHTLWAYIHVPHNSPYDATDVIIRQIERFAPGFRDTILASASLTAQGVAAANPNDIGGDIFGGALTMSQLFRRPTLSTHPWQTPVNGLYLCSASTPPGPAVHGMGGWHAARLALKQHFGIDSAL